MALNDSTVLVLGGGIAGVTAALELLDQGVKVVLAEREKHIGGFAAHIACKALDACQSCNGCLVEPRLIRALTNPELVIHRGVELASAEKVKDRFVATLAPTRGEETTLAKLGQGSEIYGQNGDTADGPITVEADAVVLAAGYQPYRAENKPRLGYGTLPNVITAWDLEAQVRREGRAVRPSDGTVPKRIAFIQCVGSRERKGNNYCSRICCGFGLRLARMLKHRTEAEVSVFYMDIQTFGHSFDQFLAQAGEELEMIRCMPADILAGENDSVLIQYQAEQDQASVHREFDMLVLSIGLTPGGGNSMLAETFGLELDQHGFIKSPLADDPARAGVFAAGTMLRPMDVAETIAQAGRTAEQTIRYLEGDGYGLN